MRTLWGGGTALAIGLFAGPLAAQLTRLLNTKGKEIIVALMMIWVLNSSTSGQSNPFGVEEGDAFHEGEYVGLLSAFREGGLKRCIMIHGPLPQILPALIAGPYEDDGYSIPAIRFIRSLFSIIALIGFIWALWETVRFFGFADNWDIFLVSCSVVMLAEGILFQGQGLTRNYFRDILFWPQSALLLRWMRIATQSDGKPSLGPVGHAAFGSITGALAVIHLFVCYERSLNIPVVVIVAVAVMSICIGLKKIVPFVGGMIFGAIVVAIAIGPDNFTPVLNDIRYWSRYGDHIWAIPVGKTTLLWSKMFKPQALVLFGAACLTLRSGWIERRNFRQWIRNAAPVILILVIAVFTERRCLARSDEPHFALAGLPTVLLLISAILWLARKQREDMRANFIPGVFWEYTSLVVVGVMLIGLNCNPFQLGRYFVDWHKNKSIVSEQTVKVVDAVRRHAGTHPSTIFTLDSNGTWYYLLGASSPSRFHHAWYALPKKSQEEIVDDLERAVTPVVIAPPKSMKLDGVELSTALPILVQYIESHYRVVEDVDGYSIYTRLP